MRCAPSKREEIEVKKRIISICLALIFTFAPASAAFSDISDSKLAQTASILDALGIMQGMGNNQFNPNGSLTRAQFCKMAVTAMGFSDVSAYGSYTIFPDVKNTHWAAPYVNAAVRHPDLKEQAIIRGYADGTFGPEKTVNFGEVCTMLLRMLGYTEADIGPFWPADYIARAQSLGLTEGVSITDPKAAVKRADAATMLLNSLGTSLKGGEGGMLLDKVASSTIKDCILLATSDTDSSLAANEAIFYEDGTVNATPRRTAGTLDSSSIGVYGTVVIGKNENNVALGIIPNGNRTETYEVTSVSADRIETRTQTLRPNRDADLYIAREGYQLGTFAEAWSGIQPGDTLTVYFDEYGSQVLMAVLPKVSAGTETSFVYGLETSPNIPAEYEIVKNGAVVDRTKLRKYDVVTLDAAERQALVSDAKISGRYEEGTPTFSYPKTVTVLGQGYAISDNAASSFADLKLNDYITLLFNTAGDVVAAFPKSTVSADMQGIVTKIDGNNVTVALMNGLTLRDIAVEAEDLSSLLGRLVTVGQSSNGKAYLTKRELSGKATGTWAIADGKLGDRVVSPDVRVYEEVASGAPLSPITVSDIEVASVPTNQIRYTVTDNAGTITNIVLGDVTGEGWLYGIGFGQSVEDETNNTTDYSIQMRYWDGSSQLETFPVARIPDRLNGTPVGIPKGYSKETVNTSVATLKLTLVDTVDLSSFDGSTGVRTQDGYYELADDIGVYVTERREFISLQNAKSNYSSFRLYANRSAEDGGKIRVIVAS